MSEARNTPFGRSHALLERALETIPTGCQTFSKASIQLPDGHAPLFVDSAEGACFTDVDGNRFVDLAMALASVTLGYRDPDVDAAVREQLERGISHSLPTALEAELAELIVSLVPSAERVRFAKNGSDGTSAAVRLARAFTGRELVVSCGYHGWHDWYIGSTTRHLGVPDAVRALTVGASANDPDTVADALREHPGAVAAVVVEPMLLDDPPEKLAALRRLADADGCLLVFDEVVTGFRYHAGGAQALYGVTPDLCALGKGMANGLPLSAVAGRADVMALMNDIFFSGTFGGEALSLAGSLAAIRKLGRDGVIEGLWSKGARLRGALETSIARAGLDDVLSVINEPCLGFVAVRAGRGVPQPALRTFMIAEMIDAGVFMNGSLAMCHAFGDAEHALVAGAFDRFAGRRADHHERPGFVERLAYPPIEPIFSVRRQPGS